MKRVRVIMVSKQRSARRAFPGTEPPDEAPDLPAQPLLADPTDPAEATPAPDAPIMLLPVGRIEVSQFESIKEPLESCFGRTVEVGMRLPVPKYAYNPNRGQYHSAAIMKRIESTRSLDWDAAIGISQEDLFVPEVPFIFGEADRSTRTALLSLARLRPESGSMDGREDLLQRRLVSEAIHQVGLLRGLAHCPNNRCVMFYAASVLEIDKRGAALCANCKKRLVALS